MRAQHEDGNYALFLKVSAVHSEGDSKLNVGVFSEDTKCSFIDTGAFEQLSSHLLLQYFILRNSVLKVRKTYIKYNFSHWPQENNAK